MLATIIITALVTALIMAAYMDVRINQESDAAFQRGYQMGSKSNEASRSSDVKRSFEGPLELHPDALECQDCMRFRGCFTNGMTYFGRRSCIMSPSRFNPSTPQSAMDQMAPSMKGD